MIQALTLLIMLGLPAVAIAVSPADVVSGVASIRSQRISEDAPTIPAEAYEKALRGETVTGLEYAEGEKAAKGWGLTVFDIDVEQVWRAVNDEEAHAGRIPVDASVIVGGDRYETDRLLFQYMSVPIVADRWWIVKIAHNGPLYTKSAGTYWEQRWTDVRDPVGAVSTTSQAALASRGIPVAFARGGWLLVRLDDGRTLCEYFTWSDPGGKVPAGIASRMASGAIKDTLKAIGQLAADIAARPTAQPFVLPDGHPMR